MRKSKNRYFYHIFVSPGDAPGAITLNIVWMEREFDAYKLSRYMCPSKYNRFWDTAIYLWKNRHFIIAYAYASRGKNRLLHFGVKIQDGRSPPSCILGVK